MRRYKLKDAGDRGWFIGDFDKAIYRTSKFEVTYQDLPRTQTPSHYHRKVTEISLIIEGKALVNGQIFTAGDICILEPGDLSQIEYLEPTKLVAVKVPSEPEDKHYL
jgi:hypothetical protein